MGRHVTGLIASIVFLVVFDIPAAAQVWDTIPPPGDGGFVISTARRGSTHYALHAPDGDQSSTKFNSELYRSTDDGVSWVQLPLPQSDPTMLHQLRVNSAGWLFYLTELAITRTSDDGATWMSAGLDQSYRQTLGQLEVDTTGRCYLLSLKHGIVTSTDHGENWNNCTFPSNRNHRWPHTRIACVGEQLFFWWGYQESADTLFRSTNHGQTWSPFLIGRSPHAVIDGGAGRLLVSQRMLESGFVPFRIMSTSNDGVTWDTLYTNTADIPLEIYPLIDPRLFVRSTQGILAHAFYDTNRVRHVLVSEDNGTTWRQISNDSYHSKSAVMFNARGHLLVYGGDVGYLRYRDFDSEPDRLGLQAVSLNLPPSVLSDGSLYALSESGSEVRTYYWSAANASWTVVQGPRVFRRLVTRRASMLFTAGADTLFAPNGGLQRSTDLGASWNHVIPAPYISYGNTSQGSGRWFAASLDSVHISSDHGRTWSATPTPFYQPWPIVAEHDGYEFFLAGIGRDMWRRPRGETVWTKIQLPWFGAAVVTGMDSTLFVYQNDGREIVRSTDRGDSWEVLNPDFGLVYEMLALSRDTLIALDTERGLAMSPNRGNSWTVIDMSAMQPRTMSMKNRRLYVGTEKLGILSTSLSSILGTLMQLQPEQSATCLPLEVTLRWNAPAQSGPYRVRFGRSSLLSGAALLLDTLVNVDSLPVSGLNPGLHYYWDVSTENGPLGSMQSEIWEFKTAPILSPDVRLPAQNENCVDPSRVIEWTSSDCLLHSELEIARDDGFQAIEFKSQFSADTTHASFALDYGTQYFVRVRATSRNGTGSWSSPVTFQTIVDTFRAPSQTSPPDNAALTHTGTISCDEIDCAKNWEVLISRSANFSADTVAQEFFNKSALTWWIPGHHWGSGKYYWKVRALRGTIPGHWSMVRSFTLDVPVHVAPITSPEGSRILDVYPMPAGKVGQRLRVNYITTGTEKVTSIVFDMLGRERLRRIFGSALTGRQTLSLDISSLSPGQYVLTFVVANAHHSVPLIIAR